MDYNHLSRGRRKTASLPRLLLAGSVVSLMIGAGFTFHAYKTHPEWAENISDYSERVSTWLAERKKNMHHGIAKVRNAPDERDDGDRPVNFEFYSTLQDMKSMEAEAHAAAQKKLAAKDNPASALKNAPKTASVKPVDDAERGSKKSQKVKISHAADIENDLLAAMKRNAGEN